MAREAVSRQEIIRRRRSSGFVGRARELALFRENLRRDPGALDYQFLFHVRGLAGVGKSMLVRRWEAVAREEGAITAVVGDDVHSALEAMEAVSLQLAWQGCPLKRFVKHLAAYQQKRYEADAASAIETAPPASEPIDARAASVTETSTSSMMAAQVGLVGLGLIPGVGALAGAVDPQQLAIGMDRARIALSSRLRSPEDIQLVLSPLQVLTPKFLEDLAEAADRHKWLVLFFDTYERTGPLLNTWLRDVLITEAHGSVPMNVQVVLAGQGRLDTACWGDSLDLVAEFPLEPFTDDEARALLAARGVADETVIERIVDLSGRLPVLLDTLAQPRPRGPDEVEDPSDTAVERFLKWESGPEHRSAVLACALPLQLNEDVFGAVTPETATAPDYGWLRGLPFVTERAGHCRYHDVIRAPMLRVQRSRSPVQWRRQQTRLAKTFRRWREAHERALGTGPYWNDAVWRDHRLNETYHLLCAQPQKALPNALHEVVLACDHSTEALVRWTQLLVQAGDDAGWDTLTQISKRLQRACSGPDADGAHTLSILLSFPQLAAGGQALGYALRGRKQHHNGLHDEALGDYSAALDRDQGLTQAYVGRAATYLQLGRYAEALADLGQAIQLEPEHLEAIGVRAFTYRKLARFDEALADFNHLIALAPDYIWALEARGETNGVMRRYEESLADFNRAIDLDDENVRAMRNRGVTLRLMHRYEESLADFNRVIEHDPQDAWALGTRGVTFRLVGRHHEALADLSHAIQLSNNPAHGWMHYERGLVRHAMDTPATADWRHAAERLQIQVSNEKSPAWRARSRKHLLMALCALSDWDRATEQLHEVFADAPEPIQLAELVPSLEELRQVSSVDTERLEHFIQQLQEKCAALSR